MTDNFSTFVTQLDSPGQHAAAVTPSDSTPLGFTARALYVGVAGNIQLITAGGETVTFVGLAAGSILPVRTTQVMNTSTTATSIVAIW